ncbi:hypothetical protein [uncultured Limosilactobacillus sp.]|uniref:hypothetical protein n=1 Tax=uncultured Limosilactobacillus sp. TaxID=2837629 RepID=UPI0025D1E00F|nr:hypothetical protein [uncultured Limosilactobacillus sp.]
MSNLKQIWWGTLLFLFYCATAGGALWWIFFALNNIKPWLLGITLAFMPLLILFWIICILMVHEVHDDDER